MPEFFPYPWPEGTCHWYQLPLGIPHNYQADLLALVEDGVVDPSLEVRQSATEGPFIFFAGYKIRVTIEYTSSDTFIVRLA